MSLSLGNVFDAHSLDYYIFWQVRFPRILAAILVGGTLAISGAIIGLLTFIANDAELRSFTFWTLGRLGNFNYSKIAILGTTQLLVIPFLLLKTKQMNAMLLGEMEAKHIGINVESLKKQQIFGIAILTGSAVAFAGGIGFIGLVVPHLIRLRFGSDHRLLLPLSYLLGGLLLLIADSLARTLAPPTEIPVGIFTAFIGAPFLGYLVLKQSSIR